MDREEILKKVQDLKDEEKTVLPKIFEKNQEELTIRLRDERGINVEIYYSQLDDGMFMRRLS